MKAKRKAPTLSEKLASVLIVGLRLPPHIKVKMSAKDVLELYECHHVFPVGMGGDNRPFNLQMMPKAEHRERTNKMDISAVAKHKRMERKRAGEKRPSRPIPGSKASPWRKRLDGTVERRSVD